MPNSACDQCRARKVKCVFSLNNFCESCIKKNQPCTRSGTAAKKQSKPKDLVLENVTTSPLESQLPKSAVTPTPEELRLMDEKLIKYFMVYHNPNFGGILDHAKLNRIQSPQPTPSETFLFFCICTLSAVVELLGPQNRISLYYYTHAKDLTDLPEAYRDDIYYEALTLLDFVKGFMTDQTGFPVSNT